MQSPGWFVPRTAGRLGLCSPLLARMRPPHQNVEIDPSLESAKQPLSWQKTPSIFPLAFGST